MPPIPWPVHLGGGGQSIISPSECAFPCCWPVADSRITIPFLLQETSPSVYDRGSGYSPAAIRNLFYGRNKHASISVDWHVDFRIEGAIYVTSLSLR